MNNTSTEPDSPASTDTNEELAHIDPRFRYLHIYWVWNYTPSTWNYTPSAPRAQNIAPRTTELTEPETLVQQAPKTMEPTETSKPRAKKCCGIL